MKGVMPVEAVLVTSGPGSEKRTRFLGFVGVWGTRPGVVRVNDVDVVEIVDEEAVPFVGLPLALRLQWADEGRSSSFSFEAEWLRVCSVMIGQFQYKILKVEYQCRCSWTIECK